MSSDYQRVLYTLKINSCPITAKHIASATGITELDDTCPKVREVIRQLINDGHCIGSNSKGYFLIQTGQECQRYLNSLMKRQIGISRRIEAVYNSAVKGGLL